MTIYELSLLNRALRKFILRLINQCDYTHTHYPILPSSSWPHDVNMRMFVSSLLLSNESFCWWCKCCCWGWCDCCWCRLLLLLLWWWGCLWWCGWCFSLVISWSLECLDSKQLSGLESFEMAVSLELFDSLESLESWLLTVESGIIVCPSIIFLSLSIWLDFFSVLFFSFLNVFNFLQHYC